jgi:hypothetical protein
MLTETVSAAQTASSLLPLDTLAATINARIVKGDKATGDADGHYLSAGLMLLEAKRRLPIEQPGKRFTAYIVGECRMAPSRAYELIRVAEGKTTPEEIRAKANERKIKHRAKPKDDFAFRNAKPADPIQEQRNIVMLAMKDATLADWTKLAKCATEIRSAREIIKQKADRAEPRAKSDTVAVKAKSAPKKLSLAALRGRRKRAADSKIDRDYCKQFGPIFGVLDRARYKLKAASLASGVDQLADVRRAQEEDGRKHAEYVREETLRREALNAPLLAPITPEKEQAYTSLVKTRTLYEGACDLSWSEYFEYRDAHPGCDPLTSDDLEYAGMWTACAVRPETANTTRH